MNFKGFFREHTFTFLREGKANWNYYTMQYKDGFPIVVALAKTGSGAEDSVFGSIKYFDSLLKTGTI